MDKEFYAKLAEKFPADCIQVVNRPDANGKTQHFNYIKIQNVIRRWNEVVAGQGAFSFEIHGTPKDFVIGDEIVVPCRLTYTYFNWVNGQCTAGPSRYIEHVGTARVTRAKKEIQYQGSTIKAGETLFLGDNIKSAISDGFKKCSSVFGIGLYLSDGEEILPESSEAHVVSTFTESVTLAPATNVTAEAANGTPASTNGKGTGAPRLILEAQKSALEKQFVIRQVDRGEFLKAKNVTDVSKLTMDEASLLIVELNKRPMKRLETVR